MLKKLFYVITAFGLLSLGVSNAVLVETSDKQRVEIPDDVASRSALLSQYTKHAPLEEDEAVPLPHVTSDTLKLLLPAMEDLHNTLNAKTEDERHYDVIEKIRFDSTPQQIIDVLEAATYLTIPLLAQAAARKLAMEPKVDELIKPLPYNLQEMVAKHYVIINNKQIQDLGFTPRLSVDDLYEFSKKKLAVGDDGRLRLDAVILLDVDAIPFEIPAFDRGKDVTNRVERLFST